MTILKGDEVCNNFWFKVKQNKGHIKPNDRPKLRQERKIRLCFGE